jgi:hypothetical protein
MPVTEPTDADIAARLAYRYSPRTVRECLRTTLLRRQAWTIHQQIAGRESEAIARDWMTGMNPQLGDRAPLLAIGAGRIRDVEVAAGAYLEERAAIPHALRVEHEQLLDRLDGAVDIEAGLAEILERKESNRP